MTLAARGIMGAIELYRRYLSPLTASRCRYHPTCSAYAQGAVAAHGPARGLLLALRRVGRCHPWAGGGLDPVPVKKEGA